MMGAYKVSAPNGEDDFRELPAMPLEHDLASPQNESAENGAGTPSISSGLPQCSTTSEAGAEAVQPSPGPGATIPLRLEDRRTGTNNQTPEAHGVSNNGQGRSSTHSSLYIDTRRAISEPRRDAGHHRLSPLGHTSSSPPSEAPFPNGERWPSPPDETQPKNLPLVSSLSPRTRSRGFSLRRSLLTRSVHDKAVGSSSILELQPSGSSKLEPRPLVSADENRSGKKTGVSVTISQRNPDVKGGATTTKETGMLLSLPNYETWVRNRTARPKFLVDLQRWGETVRKTILRIHAMPPSKDGRHLDLDVNRKDAPIDERTGRAYVNNIIRSCRYTLWNFLPRQLFAQFSKLANFYFLCVSILQMIPGLSTTGNFTTIVPLAFFVAISMAKEGYDDLRRYRLDKVENNKIASVLQAAKPTDSPVERTNAAAPMAVGPMDWANTKWEDIKVGDVVKLARNEAAPADLILLYSKGENGIAYFETMALDGETNLKSKQALPCLAKNCQSKDAVAECKAHLVVEDPNLDLYSFEGKCTVGDETLPLTNNEVIYRGSILRNTPELYGIVVYSGEECKIRMNATKNPRIKAPALQAVVNKIVIIIVLFVLALAIFNTVAYQIWVATTEKKAWYLANAKVAFFPILSSFIILFNTMIPLSLYVSLEIVKLCQLYFMNDLEMYDELSDTPMEARTSTINEELGQVNYIFSDKTGTLTNNCMKFRKLSVAGTAWLHDPDIRAEAIRAMERHSTSQRPRSKGKTPVRCKGSLSIRQKSRQDSSASSAPIDVPHSPIGRKSSVSTYWRSSARPNRPQPELRTEALVQYLQCRPDAPFARKVRIFILSIALCHTCLPEKIEGGKISFNGASPDEQALVQAAQELGFVVIDRQNTSITLKTFPAGYESKPSFEVYQILDVIEFSSSRKRMSIIVRMPDNRICVFCKGADSTLMERLRLSGLALEKASKIERLVQERQSLEAQEAIRRNSEHQNRRASIARSSLNLNRHSIGAVPRPSIAGGRLQPIRDELDTWLKERETEIEFLPSENGMYRSPRPSVHFSANLKSSVMDGRMSFQDNNIDDLVDDAMVMDDAVVFERSFQHINDFASEGLRTLLYGYRYVGDEEYHTWKKVYHDAATSLINRQEMVEKAGNLIETNLELAGATAIEDKLQEGVPDAIDKLRRAKIKMWMLTGDKRETAINIGHSCRLIKDYSSVTVLDHETGDVNQRLAVAFVEINREQVAHSVVVIDGHTLSLVEANETSKKLFIDLAILVDSVICCRASPSQKAYLVSAIRKKVKNAVTLAIGDGANDIAMIQEAHVGIGITGKEGLQAARTSDYSIAQFRFLLRLLLVHGRWNYIRTCKYTLGTFWKEMLFYLTQALYQRYAGYTGTSLYESWSLSMFNTLFTSLPVIFMGIFEKDLAASTLLAVPELYIVGHHNGGFNLIIYAYWIFMASVEAMFVFFIMVGLYGQARSDNHSDLYAMGTLTFSACVIIIATKLQFLDLHNKSITCVVAIFLSIGGWALWNLILSGIYSNNVIYDVRGGLLQRFGRSAAWWLTIILVLMVCWTFEIAMKCLKIAWAPGDVDVFQELEKDDEIRQRFETAARAGTERDLMESDEKVMSEAERYSEEQRREEDVRELLKRPRAVMGSDIREGTVRRRRFSENMDSGVKPPPEEPMSMAGKLEDEHEHEHEYDKRANYDDDDDDHGKTRKGAPTGGAAAYKRRSADVHVQELLRRGFGSVRRSLDAGFTR